MISRRPCCDKKTPSCTDCIIMRVKQPRLLQYDHRYATLLKQLATYSIDSVAYAQLICAYSHRRSILGSVSACSDVVQRYLYLSLYIAAVFSFCTNVFSVCGRYDNSLIRGNGRTGYNDCIEKSRDTASVHANLI